MSTIPSIVHKKFTKDLFDEFLESRPQGISQRTVESYHYTLTGFIGYSLTAEGIRQYLNSLSCRNGKLKFYSCLRTLFGWLHQNDHIPTDSIKRVPPPKTQKKLLSAINLEQRDILLTYCHSERDKALIDLLWYSGMRISEAVNVRTSDFNWEEGTVIVLGKGNKYRKCLAGNGVIRQWFSKNDSFNITKRGAQVMLQRLKVESGIKCNPHSFRRGFCVHLVKSGLSTRTVQALGGWENIAMVERYSKSFGFDDALSVYQKTFTTA